MVGNSFISVIIPTYNRSEIIRDTLTSLACQEYPPEMFEVLVIDDGSSADYSPLRRHQWKFTLRYEKHENKGGTATKNHGAALAQGEILIFLDDDITVSPNFISEISLTHQSHPGSIVMGHLITVPLEPVSIFGAIRSKQITYSYPDNSKIIEINFVECLGGFFSVQKNDFFQLGQMQGVGDGWPNWEDLDFAYRAYLAGYKFWLCPSAKGFHHDYAMTDIRTNAQRWEKAAKVAVLLFDRYPNLLPHVAAFKDKTPISWKHDSILLVIRKIGRSLTSGRLVVSAMENCANFLENHFPSPALLIPLYRWINSSYIFRGYRNGLVSFSKVRDTK